MPTVELTNKDLLEIWSALGWLRGQVCAVKLAYAVARNTRKLRDLVEAYNEGVDLPAAVRDFEQKRIALCQRHVKYDANGEPLTISENGRPTQFQMKDPTAFEVAWAALKAEVPDVAKLRDEHIAATKEKLKEKIAVEVYTIALTDVKLDMPPAVLEPLLGCIVVEPEGEQ